jgi:hypothetical protein
MERKMKVYGILVCGSLLFGCADMRSLEELENEAVITGDWSLVEAREALIAKRNSRRPLDCGGRLVSYCRKRVGEYQCECVSRISVMAGVTR